MLPLYINDVVVKVDDEDFNWISSYEADGRLDINERGYPVVVLKRGRRKKTLLLHRMVSQAYPHEIVHHVNRDKLDCRKVNLHKMSWETHDELHWREPFL